MSQISKAIFGGLAVALTLGAVGLASGRGLDGVARGLGGTEMVVNRAAKADRIASSAAAAVPTRTISLHLDSLPDTSVLVRVPVAKEARGRPTPSLLKPAANKLLACEPVVSVLTEIAGRLQPGRCVT